MKSAIKPLLAARNDAIRFWGQWEGAESKLIRKSEDLPRKG